MSKVSVIYRAPQGDSKVCEMFGHTFFDGKPVEIEANDQTKDAIARLSKNSCFEVSEEGKATEVKPEHDDEGDDHPTRHKGHRR